MEIEQGLLAEGQEADEEQGIVSVLMLRDLHRHGREETIGDPAGAAGGGETDFTPRA